MDAVSYGFDLNDSREADEGEMTDRKLDPNEAVRLGRDLHTFDLQLVTKELLGRVRAALDQLPNRDHEILVMRYLERMSGKEIAEVLEISESAVKMRQMRALERIKTLLKDESGSL